MSSLSPNKKAWQKFKKNYLALFALGYIAILCFLAFFSYVLAPDPTPNANEQFQKLAQRSPGFSIEMLQLKSSKEENSNFISYLFFGKERSYSLLAVDSVKEISDSVLKVYPYEGVEYTISSAELADSDLNNSMLTKTFYLGTDQLGRDILSRLLLGSRVSLMVGFFAVLISSSIGIFLGALAGFYRSWVDRIILWKMSIFWSIPTILLSMALYVSLKSYFSSSLWLIFIAIGLTMWVSMARIVRGQMMSYREIQFVEAAGSLGYSDFRIIFRHILPNLIGPIVVIMASSFANAILVESGLSFLGLGVQAPAPSWGGMLSEFKDFIGTDLSYLAVLPGFLIMSLVLAFNLVGNGLRDALDTKN
ncbi:MAG: ABC transporter permease [Chitinophagales bacterium]|nr:ABC transporter permease [Chitinophagales bacterium]